MVLIQVLSQLSYTPTDACFRPLAGIMVLILIRRRNVLLHKIASFRPLAGIMVLIINHL